MEWKSKVPKVLKDMIRCYRKRYFLEFWWERDEWAKKKPDEFAKSEKIKELLFEYDFDVKKLCEDFASGKRN